MQMVGSVLFGADAQVAAFVRERIPHMRNAEFEKYVALGIVRDRALIGGVVFHNFRGHDIEMSGASDRGDWLYPASLRTLFGYAFIQCGCRRMTTITGRRNKRARRVDEGLGFKLEGVARKALDGEEDAMIYGLLREECRFLKDRTNGL